MKLVIISDSHNKLSDVDVPLGDVLIHCGDATNKGTVAELIKFNTAIGELPHRFKLFVSGNHDKLVERDWNLARNLLTNVIILQDEEVVIDGIKFYGSPWQPKFGHGWAFNKQRSEMREIWSRIPNDVDVLITHTPPYGIMDRIIHRDYGDDESVGCVDLLSEYERISPKLHVFGHIHRGYGIQYPYNSTGIRATSSTIFINAAICNDHHEPINAPFIIDTEKW